MPFRSQGFFENYVCVLEPLLPYPLCFGVSFSTLTFCQVVMHTSCAMLTPGDLFEAWPQFYNRRMHPGGLGSRKSVFFGSVDKLVHNLTHLHTCMTDVDDVCCSTSGVQVGRGRGGVGH